MKSLQITKKWRNIENCISSADMLSELFDYLDEKTITDFIEVMEDTYDIEEYNNEGAWRTNIDFERGMTCG